MRAYQVAAVVVSALSAVGLTLFFGLYPLGLLLAGGLRRPTTTPAGTRPRSMSLVVAARNAEPLVPAKVRNSLALRWSGALELVFVSDGSRDRTAEELRTWGGQRVRVLELREHQGKAAALDAGVRRSHGEILVFSDADALLAPDALQHLGERLSDPGVGGACGRRVLQEHRGRLDEAQGGYIAVDGLLRRAESRLGSVTSNDGKLYAIRRALYRPIDPGATDDLFTCLSVVEQGWRFVFEPRARAYVRAPSRSVRHELARRRRIVARSLHGIARKRRLLDPRRYGWFALQLLVNKVLRRLLPLFLLALLAASLVLAPEQRWARILLAVQALGYGLALLQPVLRPVPGLGRLAALAGYFCVGNLGTLLGLIDFALGRQVVRWDPLKHD
ncbi:MAG TPA: glycosyltransferase [Planctomycetota bacterium]